MVISCCTPKQNLDDEPKSWLFIKSLRHFKNYPVVGNWLSGLKVDTDHFKMVPTYIIEEMFEFFIISSLYYNGSQMTGEEYIVSPIHFRMSL